MALTGLFVKVCKALLHKGRGYLHPDCICTRKLQKMELVSEISENSH